MLQGKLDDALKTYRNSLAMIKRLAATDRISWQVDLGSLIQRFANIVYYFVMAGNFEQALAISNEVTAMAPDKVWLHTNHAHALMFVGRIEEARALYLTYRGTKNVLRGKSWERSSSRTSPNSAKLPVCTR